MATYCSESTWARKTRSCASAVEQELDPPKKSNTLPDLCDNSLSSLVPRQDAHNMLITGETYAAMTEI